jgi:hypothetical protein
MAGVIKRADNLRPGDEARIHGKWLVSVPARG